MSTQKKVLLGAVITPPKTRKRARATTITSPGQVGRRSKAHKPAFEINDMQEAMDVFGPTLSTSAAAKPVKKKRLHSAASLTANFERLVAGFDRTLHPSIKTLPPPKVHGESTSSQPAA